MTKKPTMDDVVRKTRKDKAMFTWFEVKVLTGEIERMEGELQAARRRAEAAEEDWQATEAELAKFHECSNLPPSHNHITGLDASGHVAYASHTIYHKEDRQ
ncbi:MAG: hypothetical protein ACYCTG_00700 [Ferrimicrobium sp.]